jgi:hypothetical protein
VKEDKKEKKERAEYGLARSYVAQNKNFIEAELKKRRTVRSIWAELTQQGTNTVISYRNFLYNVSTLIVKNRAIDFHLDGNQSAATMKQFSNDKNVNTNTVTDSFKFSTQINPEDII